MIDALANPHTGVLERLLEAKANARALDASVQRLCVCLCACACVLVHGPPYFSKIPHPSCVCS